MAVGACRGGSSNLKLGAGEVATKASIEAPGLDMLSAGDAGNKEVAKASSSLRSSQSRSSSLSLPTAHVLGSFIRNAEAAARTSAGEQAAKGLRTPQLYATTARAVAALTFGRTNSAPGASASSCSCCANAGLAAVSRMRTAGILSGGSPATSTRSLKQPSSRSLAKRGPR